VGRIVCLVSAAGLFGFAVLFALTFHERYWRWRDCFNELGRCYDPQTQSVMTDAGFVWGLMAAASFGLAIIVFLLRGRRPHADRLPQARDARAPYARPRKSRLPISTPAWRRMS